MERTARETQCSEGNAVRSIGSTKVMWQKSAFAFTPEFNQTVTIQPDGYITLKEAGHLLAEGLTAQELETSIAGRLREPAARSPGDCDCEGFRSPLFHCRWRGYAPGEIRTARRSTTSAAVAIAGGFTQQSKHSQVLLVPANFARPGGNPRYGREANVEASQFGRGRVLCNRETTCLFRAVWCRTSCVLCPLRTSVCIHRQPDSDPARTRPDVTNSDGICRTKCLSAVDEFPHRRPLACAMC